MLYRLLRSDGSNHLALYRRVLAGVDLLGHLGSSSYTLADAMYTQSMPDRLLSNVRALEFFCGIPEILLPDNVKRAVTRVCRYDPELNPPCQQLAGHYQVAVIPARPRKPRDKPKVEVGVQVVDRRILARLRYQTFFSLAELNSFIRVLVDDLNTRSFKKLPGHRLEALDPRRKRPACVSRLSLNIRLTDAG